MGSRVSGLRLTKNLKPRLTCVLMEIRFFNPCVYSLRGFLAGQQASDSTMTHSIPTLLLEPPSKIKTNLLIVALSLGGGGNLTLLGGGAPAASDISWKRDLGGRGAVYVLSYESKYLKIGA